MAKTPCERRQFRSRTKIIFLLERGPLSWCKGCSQWRPVKQVPMGQERRNSRDEITASYAIVPHRPDVS